MERPEQPAGDKPASRPTSRPPTSLSRGAAALGPNIDLRQVLIILRAHILIAATLAVVVCTLLGWQQMRRPRIYESDVTLTLERRERVVDLKRFDESNGEPFLATRIGELQSDELAEYVLKSLSAEERAAVVAPYLSADRPVRNPEARLKAIVKSSMTPVHEPGTLLATLRVMHRDPDVAAMLANRFADQFIRYLFDKSSASNNAALAFLRDQAEDLRTKLEASERSLQEYRSRYNLVSLDESQNIVVDRLKALNSSTTGARVRRSEIEVRLAQAETTLERHANPIELANLTGSSALAEVQQKIDDVQSRRAILAERYGKRHPTMQELSRTLDALEKLRTSHLETAIASLRSQRDKAVSEEKELIAQLAKAEAEALRLDQIGVEYGVLRRALETQKTIYTQILSRLNEASISAQLESVNVRIADRAFPNPNPISPDSKKTALILIGVALAILLGYPFTVELLFAKVRSGGDVEYYLNAPLLGEIGSVARTKESDRPLLVLSGTEEVAAEQFRALFSQLQLTSKIDPPKSILITSTVPGEGKSFIASNLAGAFVAHGRRVLLIDGDLRRASQHRHYNVDNRSGLLRWLEGSGTIDDNIEKNEELGIIEVAPRLFLLRAGGSTRRATELVGSGRLDRLIEVLQRRFDVVIIDTPPLGVFSDAISFAEFCHEFVFVCRFGVASRQHVRTVLERLRQTGLDFAGVVLNALPAGRGTSYYYYHGYSSDSSYARQYGEKPEKKKK